MNSAMGNRNLVDYRAKIVGVLFIVGTAAGILGQSFIGPVLGASDYLVKFSSSQNQVIVGVSFELIMAVACACIAIWLFPVLKGYSESLALGAVGFRLVEGVFYIVAVISLILLLTVSQDFVNAGAPDSSYFQTLGDLLKTGYSWVSNVAVLMSWCVGALMYYYIFYRTKLIPRWLSGWGLAGVMLCIVSSTLVMFHYIEPLSTVQVVINLPIALQEMVMALWLIVKGFDQSATVVRTSDRTATG